MITYEVPGSGGYILEMEVPEWLAYMAREKEWATARRIARNRPTLKTGLTHSKTVTILTNGWLQSLPDRTRLDILGGFTHADGPNWEIRDANSHWDA